MAVTKRTRFEVLRRDNHTCRYCGGTAPDAVLTVDHVTPVALGGTDDPSNLVAACKDCNAGKSSTKPDEQIVEDVKAIDLRWADAMKRAAAALEEADRPRQEYLTAFWEAWPGYRSTPMGAEGSVAKLFDAGLPVKNMTEAVWYATHNKGVYDRFAYFMGICWKQIREMQDIAKQLLAAEEVGE